MIRVAEGSDVIALLRNVSTCTADYAEFLVCSPFIDLSMVGIIVNIAICTRQAHCGFRILTSRAAAYTLFAELPGHRRAWPNTVIVRERLHAKAYIAIGRKNRETSEAIVTSANLTVAGLTSNVELGVRAIPTSAEGRQLLEHFHHYIRRLTDA